MAHQGQAADYYNSQNYGNGQYSQPQQGYQQQYAPPPGPPSQSYQQQGYQQYAPPAGPHQQGYQQQQQQQPQPPQAPKYTQQPPTYGANFVPPQDDKQSFQDTFKIQKPKYNDVWAGLLVCCNIEYLSVASGG